MQSFTEFLEHIKTKSVPRGYHLISFDVISLFTNVPLDATIDIVLKRIYDDREINTTISKREMKELIKLCTKDIRFNFIFNFYHNIFNFGNIMSMTPSVLFVMDTKNFCCHVSIIFIIPSSLHMKLKKKMEYSPLTS